MKNKYLFLHWEEVSLREGIFAKNCENLWRLFLEDWDK